MVPHETANRVFNAMTGRTSYTAPSTVYFGYCQNEPSASNGAVSGEPNDGYYERLKIKTSVENYFGQASGGYIVNTEEIRMPCAQVAQGTQNWFFLSESPGGNAFLYGPIVHKNKSTGEYEQGLTIGEETIPVFYKGTLRASLDVALPPRP